MSSQWNLLRPSLQRGQHPGLVTKLSLAVRVMHKFFVVNLLVVGSSLFAGGCTPVSEQVEQVIPVGALDATRVPTPETAAKGVAHSQGDDVVLAPLLAPVLIARASEPSTDHAHNASANRRDVAVVGAPESHWFVLIPGWLICFLVSAVLSAGGPSAILNDWRERRRLFALEAARTAAFASAREAAANAENGEG